MPDAAILYRFVATGQGSVEAAFKSIDAAARSSSRSVEAAARATEKARGGGGAGRGRTGSADDRAYKEAERYAAKIERESKRAADAQIREAARAAQHVAGIRDRHFREEQRAADKAAQRAASDDAKWRQRAIDKYDRAKERTSADRMRTLTGMGRDAALGAVGIGASALGVVGQAAREGVRLQDIAARLSINARGAGEKGADATTLRREFENAAIANPGVKAEDVAAGAAGFVAKTGDLSAARRFSGTFATVSSASGASVEDISNAAADLFQKFDITSIEDMQKALAALTMQGKAGAFEIKDAAAQFAKMSAAASRFGLSKGSEGVKILGGLTQIARSATGSPEQAATAVEATFRQLIAKSGTIKGLGVNVFEKGSKSKTRDVRDILTETIAKAGGGQVKLQEIFGEEGIRGISPLISAFNNAKGAAKGTEAEKTAAGVTALREALAKAIDAPGDWAEIVKDSAAAQQTAGAQLDAAWESIKATVSKEAIPAIMKLVPAMTQLAETGIGPAIVVFQALVEAAGDAVEALKIMGLLNPKEKPAAEQLKEAKAKLENFNNTVGSGINDTPEQRAERMRLIAAVDAADKKAFTTTAVGVNTKGAGAGPETLTPDEFANRYAEASGVENDFWHSGQRGDIEDKARRLADSLVSDPNQGGLPGENDAQAKVREQYAAQVIGDGGAKGGEAGGQINTADLDAQLKRTAATVALFEASMRRATGGSIVGDTQ